MNAYAPLLAAHWDLKQTDELRASLDELREAAEGWFDDRARGWAYLQLSYYQRLLGDDDKALTCAERARELDPTKPQAYVARLEARQRTEGDTGIEEDCDRLASLDIEDLNDDRARAWHLANTCKRPEQGIKAYTRVIERAPQWADAYRWRGSVYFNVKRFEEALGDLKKAVELAPQWPDANNTYARTLLTSEPASRRDPARALELATDANDLTEFRNADYLDTLALAYHRTGDTEKAIETQRTAISLLPKDADRTDYEKRLAEFESALQHKSE